MSIPFEAINAAALAALPSLLGEWFPRGVRRGHEFVIGDLRGSPGESLSININTAKWADFASDARGGDPVSICAAAFHGGDRVAAAKDLGRRLGVFMNGDATPHVSPPAPAKPAETWKSCDPPEDAPKPDISGFDVTHIYRDAGGRPVRYIGRKEAIGDKRKLFVPLTYGTLNGVVGWHKKQASKPRCLYGLDRLAAMPDAIVVLVEGEKAAEAASALFPSNPCVTWSGGAESVSQNDWSALAGRRVIVWPDNDPPGHKAAAVLRATLSSIARQIETLYVDDLPDGADAADVSPADPASWLRDRLTPPEPPHGVNYEDYDQPPQQAEATRQTAENIIPLGHDRGNYYYLSTATGQVEEISAGSHTRAMLSHLASETYYWSRTRFINKTGVDWNAAADDLRVRCRSAGIYNPDRVRGRGAWLDGDRSVLHIGDRCIVDGVESGLMIPGSRFVYEHSPELAMDIGAPLSTEDANQLRQLCVAAPWESPDHMGQLLSGWCVIAPVCGAMPWRPHLWLTSEPGGGKTWVLDNIIKPIVGPIALEVQSKTTEAGIRQTLGCDARPVIFDEAETQNERDRDRVQLVLDLARQASSEGGAAIIKGSANGKAMQYHIRSCFAFSSINVGLSQAADESRTVVLTLSPDTDDKKRSAAFAALKAIHAKTMTPGFSGRLLARTLSLLPVIRQNAVIFAEAIARSGKPRRTGDTYGVLMAGAWSLRSRSVITAEEADKQVAGTQWVREAVVKADVDPEWKRALTILLQYRSRLTNANGRTEDVPIGELIRCVASGQAHGAIHPFDAKLALSRIGIKLGIDAQRAPVLHVANHSSVCCELFAKTPWAASWLGTLTRMPGAKRNAATVRLGGSVTKVFSLPIPDMVSPDED